MSEIEGRNLEDTPEALSKRIIEHVHFLTEAYMAKFHERIKTAREAANYERNELAERMKCTPASIGMYETGKRKPDLQTLITFCLTTNINPSWLLGFGGEQFLRDKGITVNAKRNSLIDMLNNSQDYEFIESLFMVCSDRIIENARQQKDTHNKRKEQALKQFLDSTRNKENQ